MRTGFFAYSGSPKSSGESIEEAIKEINSGRVTELRSWRNYTVSGKLIIKDVTEAINNSNYFCADLTGMSDNVLFELGYAIAKNKPIFLLLDTSHTDSFNKYRELSILTTFGYSKYTNTQNIVDAFFREKTFEVSDGLLPNLMGKTKVGEDKKSLLLLKNQIDSNYNKLILNKTQNEYKLSYILEKCSHLPLLSHQSSN
jgi:hypothetical protein